MAMPGVPLSEEEITRYARHIIMPEVGMAGQLKLKRARVLAVGTGGLGSAIAIYLTAAGIGKLGLVDSDLVEISNLQRQVLHGTSDLGRSKLASARETLGEINPHVDLETYDTRLSRENALRIIKDYDVVVDGTDNIPSRYLLSDACVLLDKPLVHASVYRFEGQATVFYARQGPCYRCVYPEPPPPGLVQRVAVGGILGVQPGIFGCIQALEVIKLILGRGKPLIGRLLVFDGVNLRFRELKLHKDPDCPACGVRPTITEELMDYDAICGVSSPGPTVPTGAGEIEAAELCKAQGEGRPFVILDIRDPAEFAAGHIPGARSIPLRDLLFHLHEFTWADEFVVCSGTGRRGREAAETLAKFNFRKTRILKGGLRAWREHGGPTTAS